MKMQKLNLKKHNTLKVSELIYETDSTLFDFFFKDKETTAKKIEKLVRYGNNNLGYEKIMVLTKENSDDVLGVLVYSCGLESRKRDETKILHQNLSLWDVLKFKVMEWLDSYFLSDLNETDFYLACLAVDEEARGKGIGTLILQEAIEIAKANEFERVVLDVDINNKRALNLYKRLGFTVFNKKTIPWIGRLKGTLNMEYSFVSH